MLCQAHVARAGGGGTRAVACVLLLVKTAAPRSGACRHVVGEAARPRADCIVSGVATRLMSLASTVFDESRGELDIASEAFERHSTAEYM